MLARTLVVMPVPSLSCSSAFVVMLKRALVEMLSGALVVMLKRALVVMPSGGLVVMLSEDACSRSERASESKHPLFCMSLRPLPVRASALTFPSILPSLADSDFQIPTYDPPPTTYDPDLRPTTYDLRLHHHDLRPSRPTSSPPLHPS